ncbi:hypothetical protein AGABI2DRAFT_121220 [Agaricus bisporus var. bisporus H97]|uniref:hypothetical protein n=1 Tax=Agaricus bisporus var. bisporus (strain H97 / ATCC MYA-4626 / FGSC 10389) TaxID=936046 RepID=UPI00029F7613|nr:hypothetical protein AGABI2DRAFT_121220 [Agaricus bisporus var. bisporus H97]EKV44027.1 hypothetical protein AGABI2DRAFT_121220 [Agaricus bisporus var. bisporus H97]
MQAFQNAQNFVVSNPVFSHQSNHYQSGLNGGFHPEFRTKSNHSTQGIEILRESSAPEATFDSDSRRYAPSCFPGTRLQYIKDILNWATAQSAFPIYRMTGPAGVGKTAIAQTCAEELRSRCHLGASFFFTVHGCSDYSRFFTSISYQLSSKSPDYHEILDKKLRLDPTIVRKQLRSQFRELIIEPIRELELVGKPVGGRVILVDGLDECKDKKAQREIIDVVTASVATCTTPFYWAFFSRPEPQIEAAFADHRVTSLCISTFLPISRGIDGEIELYLRCGLQDILRHRGITTSVPWPSEQVIRTLVSAAQGLYIYAATVLRFVGRTDTQYDPQELLHIVLTASSQCSYGSSMRTPFEELDAFYTLILQRVPSGLLSSIQLLLSLMVLRDLDGEVLTSIRLLSNMLRLTETKMKLLCGELVAVVHHGISNSNQGSSSLDTTSHSRSASPAVVSSMEKAYAREGALGFYHKSFFDFLCDPIRSGRFCVTTPTVCNKLFQYLVELQIHYSKSYSFRSNCGLVLAANESGTNLADVQHELSWPFDVELFNPIMRVIVFEAMGGILLDRFFPYDNLDNQLLSRFSHMDHRKQLFIQSSWVFKPNVLTLGLNFGYKCIIKNVQETMLCSTIHHDMLNFDAEKFREGISRLEAAQVIQRYQPSSTTLDLPLFRCDSDGNALSGLYIKGRGQASTFWYWILDPEMRYFRDFETVDLAEGERIFREENFELWDVDLADDDWSSSGYPFSNECQPSDDEM